MLRFYDDLHVRSKCATWRATIFIKRGFLTVLLSGFESLSAHSESCIDAD